MADRTIVVLDRVRDDWTPPYCIHGKATCVRCGHWVWLGSETYGPVASGAVNPLCLDCAKEIMPTPDSAKLLGHIKDHLRADGPHL